MYTIKFYDFFFLENFLPVLHFVIFLTEVAKVTKCLKALEINLYQSIFNLFFCEKYLIATLRVRKISTYLILQYS